MMKAGPVAMSIVLAVSLGACGSRMEQNQAASDNVTSAPLEVVNNVSIGENVSAPNTRANEMLPIEQASPATPARPVEPRRTSPAPKAELAPRPAQPADPHAGHDMGNMMHNQSGSAS